MNAKTMGTTDAAQCDERAPHEPCGGSILLLLLYAARLVKHRARSERKIPMMKSAPLAEARFVRVVKADLKAVHVTADTVDAHAELRTLS